jgi:fatty acid desaturase
LLRGVNSPDAAVRSQARRIVGVQLFLIAIGVALGHPWVYFILWLAPFLTVWRVINRLRSIAEHGGMQRSKDRRLTSHSVRQTWPARFALVPFHIGWHLAHHVDSGIPMANLPKFHAELRRTGYVTDELEYRSYTQLWSKLSGR